jgi:DNA-binding SARP family transcriptional activator
MGQDIPPLEIKLFGNPRLFLNGQLVANIRRKNRALIFYLAAHTLPLTRENLLTFFWPVHERAAAQQILRTMIHDLRKHLRGTFQSDSETLALAQGTSVDLNEFSAGIKAAAADPQMLITVLSLYQGDFLEGFSLADSPQFDDWAVVEREHYRLIAIRGFADLARFHGSNRNFQAGLDAIRRALAFNPLQEDLQQEFMRLLYLSGDRTGVIRQYDAFRKMLNDEMSVRPMPETRALYDAIITDTLLTPKPTQTLAHLTSRFRITNYELHNYKSPSEAPIPNSQYPITLSLPFTGREAELQAFKTYDTSGKLILLEGEPGIGKTRLALEIIAAHRDKNEPSLILRGVAYELEQGLPYQPLIEALRGLLAQPDWKSLPIQMTIAPVWLTEIVRLLPELLTQFPQITPPDQPADEARLWESLLQFFHALA